MKDLFTFHSLPLTIVIALWIIATASLLSVLLAS